MRCTVPASCSAPGGDGRGRQAHALRQRLQRAEFAGVTGIQRDLGKAVPVELDHGDTAGFIPRRLLAAQVGLVPVQGFTGEAA
ncbi:hypothetical protein, partial [Dryocola clanedunensis]